MLNNRLVIIGASGHGEVCSEIAYSMGYRDIVFLDDFATASECNGYPVEGDTSSASSYSDADFFIAIGESSTREMMFFKLYNAGYNIVSLVHPSAIIARQVSYGPGCVIMPGVIINPGVTIGTGCIINTSASVDHDCKLGDFCHVSVGARLAGGVVVGDMTWIGVGATVSDHLSICDDCLIGAGAVVVKNIDLQGTYVGVPASLIKGAI